MLHVKLNKNPCHGVSLCSLYAHCVSGGVSWEGHTTGGRGEEGGGDLGHLQIIRGPLTGRRSSGRMSILIYINVRCCCCFLSINMSHVMSVKSLSHVFFFFFFFLLNHFSIYMEIFHVSAFLEIM